MLKDISVEMSFVSQETIATVHHDSKMCGLTKPTMK